MVLVSSKHDTCDSGQRVQPFVSSDQRIVSRGLRVLHVLFAEMGCDVPFAVEWFPCGLSTIGGMLPKPFCTLFLCLCTILCHKSTINYLDFMTLFVT